MVIFSDKVKNLLKQMQDETGKIMITDTMPDDLKEAIEIINKNNVDLDKGFQTLGDVNVDDIEELSNYDDEDIETDINKPIVEDNIIEDNSAMQANISDLESFF